MGKVTIKDVAREANVAISTVSNTLNGAEHVSDETRKKVMEVVDRLNYVPNFNGQALKKGSSKVIGLITIDVKGNYFYILVDQMYKECEKRGYGLNVIVSRDRDNAMHNILGQNFDALCIFADSIIEEPEIELIRAARKNVVFIDRAMVDEHISSVVFNSFETGYEVTKYLIDNGHEKILYLKGDIQNYDSNERKRGYKAALKEAGIPIREEYILQGFFDERKAYKAMNQYLDQHPGELPDAVIGGNDLGAIGVMKALKQRGYKIPQDVSVLGFDDIEVASYYRPPLTTVRNPIPQQGVKSMELLFEMLEDGVPGRIETLNGELVIRKSCREKGESL